MRPRSKPCLVVPLSPERSADSMSEFIPPAHGETTRGSQIGLLDSEIVVVMARAVPGEDKPLVDLEVVEVRDRSDWDVVDNGVWPDTDTCWASTWSNCDRGYSGVGGSWVVEWVWLNIWPKVWWLAGGGGRGRLAESEGDKGKES